MNQILPCPVNEVGWKSNDCIYLIEDFMYSYIVNQLDPFSGEPSYMFFIGYLI